MIFVQRYRLETSEGSVGHTLPLSFVVFLMGVIHRFLVAERGFVQFFYFLPSALYSPQSLEINLDQVP